MFTVRSKFLNLGKLSAPRKSGMPPEILARFAENVCNSVASFKLSGIYQERNGLKPRVMDFKEVNPEKKSVGMDVN